MLNSLIGIIASSGGVTVSNSYESIATVTVGAGGQSSVTIYGATLLQSLLWCLLCLAAISPLALPSLSTELRRHNGYYIYHFLDGNGSSASAGAGTSQTRILAGRAGAANSGSNIFGVNVLDVLDYANTNKYKTARILGGIDRNGDGNIRLDSGVWMNTAAVTSLTISPTTANNFVQYSSFALYGIKG